MTLNAAIEAELPFLRAEAEARMTSRVTIRRKTGATAQNESTGEEVPVWTTVATAVPFRLVPKGSRIVEVGGVEFSEATARGDVPHDTAIEDDDYFDITSGEWAGSAFRVIEAVKGDQRTARRLPITEVPRPEEW